MSRLITATATLAIGVLACASATFAAPKYPAPEVMPLDPEAVARSIAAAEFEVLPADGSWENQDMMAEENDHSMQRLLVDDNDSVHYNRGRTMIIHVFIDHSGGTWSTPEMDAAGVKAQTAKNLYLDSSPAGANVYFDHPGSSAYFSYSATLGYDIPEDSMTWAIVEDAVADIGFADSDTDGSRVDDMTLWLQQWGDGWDNVIAVFQPADITGRASASYGHGKVIQYTDDVSSVWRHEWGHSFGACDEYEEGGECNGGVDCGNCQSSYLHATNVNGNCQLPGCPIDVSCIMINNVSSICSYTREHWAWTDDDTNGVLDNTKRRTSGSSFVNIFQSPQDSHWLWNSTTHGWSIQPRENAWGVLGVRSPSTADYDVTMYGDNNHNYPLASSSYGGQTVDFVVGDYNHSGLGVENIQVTRFSGATDDYRINYDGNTSTTYPDGVVRNYNWGSPWAARALDIPLYGGETVTFVCDVTSGSLDLGISLFKSSGSSYYAGRSSAQWTRDAGGAGATETWTYTAPEDDVYGLIIFSNSAATGAYSIKVGPTPATLAEETPFHSGLPLRLFNYDPNSSYWAFIGNRPVDPGNTTVQLYNNSTYQSLLEESNNYNSGPPNNSDFIAVDYNHASGAVDYPRVIEISGTTHRTEWEHDADILAGSSGSISWTTGHVGKAWDMFLTSGQNYFFREYHSGALDTGLYLFSSSDGDYYNERADWDGASNSRAGSAGGEWFSYTAPSSNWYGVYTIVNDESAGSFSLWAGARVTLTDDVAQTRSDEIVFGSSTLTQTNWMVVGARPQPGQDVDVWLYGDNAYTITSLAVFDFGGAGQVSYVVGDYNHVPTGVVYPRFRRSAGTGSYTYELEAQFNEDVIYLGGAPVSGDFSWGAGDVVETIEVWLPNGVASHIKVEVLSGSMDLGLELFDSNGSTTYYSSSGNGVDASDVSGSGGVETLDYTATGSDWHGLIVYNNNTAGGTYRVTIGNQTAVGVAQVGLPTQFEFAASPNPFRGQTGLQFALPTEDNVNLSVYDISGRLVKTLINETRPAGNHTVTWDGRDMNGSIVATGVYLTRIRTSTEEQVRKVTLVK